MQSLCRSFLRTVLARVEWGGGAIRAHLEADISTYFSDSNAPSLSSDTTQQIPIMLRLPRTLLKPALRPSRALCSTPRRLLATQLGEPQPAAAAPPPPAPVQLLETASARAKRVAKTKDEGNISSVFASLSGEAESVLPDRFIELKKRIIDPEDKALVEKVTRSWASLLGALEVETEEIERRGPDVSK